MLPQAQRLRRMRKLKFVPETPARTLAETIDVNEFNLGVAITGNARTESVAIADAISATVDLASGDADVVAWKNAVITAGGSVSGDREDALTIFVAGLKTDGIWVKLDRLWIYAAENTQSALIDIKNRVAASPVNSPSFMVDRGYTGNNSSSYINTNFDPSINGVNYTRNSASGGIWLVDNVGAGSSDTQIGALAAGAYAVNIAANPGGNVIARINQTASITVSNPGIGLLVVNRSGSSAAELYYNGSSIGTNTGASAALIAQPVYVGARNNAGTADTFAPDQIGACFFAASLDATDQSNLFTRFSTFMMEPGVVEPDADLAAWKVAVLAAGGTLSVARQNAMRTFIEALKTDGLWTKFDRLWIYAAENSQSALIDLKARAAATLIGTPTFTANLGYACNGSNYVETNYTPSVNGVNYTANAAHVSAWNVDNSSTWIGYPLIASSDATIAIYPQYSDGLAYIRINDNWSTGATAAADRRGLYFANRSTFSTEELYLNGVNKPISSANSQGLPAVEVLLYAWTGAALSLGGTFNSSEQLAFYNHMRTLMTVVGVP